VLRAVWLAYGIPLLLALGGALLVSHLTGSEPLAAAAVPAGLAAGVLLMRRWRLESRNTQPILSLGLKDSTHFIVRGP